MGEDARRRGRPSSASADGATPERPRSGACGRGGRAPWVRMRACCDPSAARPRRRRDRRRGRSRLLRPRPGGERLRDLAVCAAAARPVAARRRVVGLVRRRRSSRASATSGANLVPVEATARRVDVFADAGPPPGPPLLVDRRAGGRRRSPCGTLLEPALGPGRARSGRGSRCMVTDRPAAGRPRPAGAADAPSTRLDVLMPACVAMFTEEVGVSPVAADGGALVPRPGRRAGRAPGGRFARIERTAARCVFKAELGVGHPARRCQVQGVWVNPQLPRPGAGGAGDGRRRAARAGATSRRRSRCTSTTTTLRAVADVRAGRLPHGRAAFVTVLF